jgi:heme-degrading monooxygenase HmoA
MVARTWRGWTAAESADEVAASLREGAVARYSEAPGCLAAQVLCRPIAGGVEVMTLTLWESSEALPSVVEERHNLLVARQTIPACWDVVGEPTAIAAAA